MLGVDEFGNNGGRRPYNILVSANFPGARIEYSDDSP
jgi:hypothetical protein